MPIQKIVNKAIYKFYLKIYIYSEEEKVSRYKLINFSKEKYYISIPSRAAYIIYLFKSTYKCLEF